MPRIGVKDIGEFPVAGYDELIQTLYSSSVNPDGFHLFLKLLADTINAKFAALIGLNDSPQRLGKVWTIGISDHSTSWQIDEKRVEDDLVFKKAVQEPMGSFNSLISLLNGFKPNSGHFCWNLDQQILDSAWVTLSKKNGTVLVLLLLRGTEQLPYTQKELNFLNQFIPHIRQAMQLYQQVNHHLNASHSLAGIIEALPKASIILDRQAGVVYASKNAKKLLKNEPAIELGELLGFT